MIPDKVLEEIQDRLDIVEVISGYIPLKKAGRNFKAACPFHGEKTPSFMVNPVKKIYHCFGCGAGGDVIGFVMKYEKLEFPEAVKMLAKKAGVAIPESTAAASRDSSLNDAIYRINELAAVYFHSVLTKSERGADGRKYLQDRKLHEKSVADFKLGFACQKWDGFINFAKEKGFNEPFLEKAGLAIKKQGPGYYDRFRNRVVFPIFDLKSKVIAFGARACDTSLPKYLNSPETQVYTKGRHLYGLNFSKSEILDSNQAVIVEGYLDFLMPYQSGVRNIVASLGTALTTDQVRLLKRFSSNIVMVYDGDAAGEAATLRGLDMLLQEDMVVRIVNLAKEHDPDSFIRKFGPDKFKGLVSGASTLFEYKLGILKKRFDPKSVEEKVSIVNEMLPTIAKINNSVLKSEYIKRLSEELSCSEEALLQELSKARPEGDYPLRAKDTQKQPALRAQRMAEKILAGLMLDDKQTARSAMEHLKPEEFKDFAIRGIVSEIFEMAKSGKDPSSSKIMLKLGEKSVQELVAELACAAQVVVEKDKSIIDCIKSIKRDNIKEELSVLHTRIKVAHGSADDEKTNELLDQCNKLTKEYKTWSQ